MPESGLESIASIATGITTIFGVIGLILYVYLYIINKSGAKHYSLEVIEALKKVGVTAEEASKLSQQKLTTLLHANTSLTQQLIGEGINKESKRHSTFLMISTIGCFILATFFGMLWSRNDNKELPVKYSGVVWKSGHAVQNASIFFTDGLEKKTTLTDGSGHFHIYLKSSALRLGASHPGCDTTWKNIETKSILQGVTDTVRIFDTPLKRNIVRIKGNVLSDANDQAIEGAMVTIDGDSTVVYSKRGTGYFEFDHEFGALDHALLRVRKDGFVPFEKNFDIHDTFHTVSLER